MTHVRMIEAFFWNIDGNLWAFLYIVIGTLLIKLTQTYRTFYLPTREEKIDQEMDKGRDEVSYWDHLSFREDFYSFNHGCLFNFFSFFIMTPIYVFVWPLTVLLSFNVSKRL